MYNKIFESSRRNVLEKRKLNKESRKQSNVSRPLAELNKAESNGVFH